MNKELDFDVEDLGTASVETQGVHGAITEAFNQQLPNGISDVD